MEGLQPLQSITDYKVAVGVEEVNKLLAEGYEPEGKPHFSTEASITSEGGIGIETMDETVIVRQVMVKREPFTAAKYLKLMKALILLQGQLQDLISDPAKLFTKSEVKEFAESMGEEISDEELAEFKDD